MAKQTSNNVKLGLFVLSGLLFLVLLLYMIGKNSNLFGNTYLLKARFSNIQGLVVGNNVRYAGIEAGTVKKIQILNDSVVEVDLVIRDNMKSIIRKNARVSIGTEGLVGNKVINILPSPDPQPAAEENDILVTQPSADTDEMLQILDETNRDVGEIAEELKKTIRHINSSTSLWTLLEDESLHNTIRASASNVHDATRNANAVTYKLHALITDIKSGRGSVGSLLTDTSYAHDIAVILDQLETVSNESGAFVKTLDSLLQAVKFNALEGDGPLQSMLMDSLAAQRVRASLENIEGGTAKFNQNMEALKHNFFFRGYFKKEERKQRRQDKKS